MQNCPNYLKDYENIWLVNQKKAKLEWFKNAKYGLFLHFGLYSQLGRGEWVQYFDEIPVNEYAKLFDTFNPKKFDADFITDLTLEAGMKYVNITTCHHESFCLWNSKTESFNSVNSPAKRDLIAGLKEECDKKGLGFFAYYTHMANWKHPHFITNDYISIASPQYEKEQPEYTQRGLENFHLYLDYMRSCIKELLTEYGDIAGIWLDIIIAYYQQPKLVDIEKTYELIRTYQPSALISFKQGATGTEDFATPEHSFRSLEESCRNNFGEKAALIARNAFKGNRNKHNKICATLQDKGWGYNKEAKHKTPDEVMAMLTNAWDNDCNLLLNTGPLGDGSLHTEDVKTLREVGRRLR